MSDNNADYNGSGQDEYFATNDSTQADYRQSQDGYNQPASQPHNPDPYASQQPVQGYATVVGSEVGLRLTLDAEKVARESAASDKQAQALSEERERRRAELADSLAEAEVPALKPYRPQQLVREFARSLRRELDLAGECRQAERIATNMAVLPHIVIPRVHWAYTRERINVQDFIDGTPGGALAALTPEAGFDRTVLAQEVEAARATRSTQSTADEADKATYTPGYILRHPVDTVLLFVRSAVENGDHYIRTLVGGSLSYYTVDLAWGWVAVLYLLLAYAALPVQGAVMKPAGKARGWCCAAAALCCLLAVAGCLLWTPTHYDTLYGLQGRYFLPVLPLLLLTCLPRRLAAVPDEDTAQTRLVAALALVQAGMVVNIMLAIIAR